MKKEKKWKILALRPVMKTRKKKQIIERKIHLGAEIMYMNLIQFDILGIRFEFLKCKSFKIKYLIIIYPSKSQNLLENYLKLKQDTRLIYIGDHLRGFKNMLISSFVPKEKTGNVPVGNRTDD